MIKKFFTVILGIFSLLWGDSSEQIKAVCMTNDASACYAYALPLVTGDNAKVQDLREEGLGYMRKACVLGHNKACDVMGENYYKDKSYIAARPYLEQSCNRGVKTACEAIAVIYRDAHDVRHDDVKAREFFEKACDLKSADACYNVAIIYRGGFGIEKSRTNEKAYYKKACNAGLQAGCNRYTELDNEDKGIKTGIWADIKALFN